MAHSDQPTAEEWWATRCGIIHSYGVETERHESDSKLRIMTWVRNPEYACKTHTLADGTPLVFVNITAMHTAFRKAIQDSLVHAMESEEWRDPVCERLAEFVQAVPLDPGGTMSKFLSS